MESRFLYDALSFTSRNNSHDLAFVLNLLGFSEAPIAWSHIHGAKGYKHRDYYDGVNINYEHDDIDKFLWVELSGQGCRVFETFGNGDYNKLFDWILNTDGVQITRLDIAFDDREELLFLNDVATALNDGDYCTHFQSWEITKDNNNGCTIYIGSKKSKLFFRLYDKAIERGYYDRSCGHWVRVEAQLRHEKAQAWIEQGLKPENIINVLSDLIRFTDEYDYDSHKNRRQNAVWWDKFIGTAINIHLLSKPGVEYNLEKLKEYVFGQAGPSIYCAIDNLGINNFLGILSQTSLNRYKNNPKYNILGGGKICSNAV